MHDIQQRIVSKVRIGIVGSRFQADCIAASVKAMPEGFLRAADIRGLSRPRLLRRRLQRTPVREREVPRDAADAVDRVEVGGRLDVGLTA